MPATPDSARLPAGFPIDRILAELKTVDGLVAVVLGGSWAFGRARPDSDVDLGLCYRADRPLDIDALKQVAERLNDTPNPVVTQIGGWGIWVNGGSWLTISGQRTDFLYRDLDFLNGTIDEVIAGHSRPDYWQQSPYGFHSQTYCAETRLCVPLDDPEGVIPPLKAKVQTYPDVLKRRVVNGFLWGHTHEIASKFAHRQEPYLVVGCLTRIACELIQVVYALNETFFLGDKHVYQDIGGFTVVPPNFMARVDAMMGGGIEEPELKRRIGLAIDLRNDVMALAGDLYTPRY